jgi:hypothetical protein
MVLRVIAGVIILLTCGSVFAQTNSDSLRVSADTVFVFPAGPVAGSFTNAARVAVVDTIAGWAKIQFEGWVPVRTVLNRLNEPTSGPLSPMGGNIGKAHTSFQLCEGVTTKGARCKRKASPGSKFCWQHQ